MHSLISVPPPQALLKLGLQVALVALVVLPAACSRDPRTRMAAYIESGDRYAENGRLAEAVIEYRNAVQAQPSDGDARLKLAETLLKNGDAANAVREYVRAADLLPDRLQVQLTTGSLLLVARQFDDARVRAGKALALAPRDVQAQILLANASAGMKDLEGAVEEIEEAIRLAPDRGATYASLGTFEAGRGRWDAAEEAFRKATELDAGSASPHLALANFYWARTRLIEAEEQLNIALAREPDNLLAHRMMARFSLLGNRPAETEKHLKRIVEIAPTHESTLALAEFYISRNNSASARALLHSIEAPEGKPASDRSAQANVLLAALDRADGRADEAYARLDRVLAADRTHLQALLTRSQMLLGDKRPDEALAPAESAVKYHATSSAAHSTLGRVQASRKQTDLAIAAYEEALRLNPRAREAQLALSRLHMAAGRSTESVRLAQDALRSDPADNDARLLLVRGLVARGEDLGRASTELARLLAEFPRSAVVHVQQGLLLFRNKDITGARAAFEQALRLDPESVEALGGLVAVDLASKQPEAARERVRERADRSDATPALLMLAARTHAASGDLNASEQVLRRLLEKDATYLPAYSALGQLYARQGRLDAALAQFDALTQRNPRSVGALTIAGILLQAQGKSEEARVRFERVMEIEPTAPVAANNLAWIYAESGSNLDVALQLAQTARRGLPDSAEVNDTLGFVLYRKGLAALAIAPFKASVEKDGANPVYHFHLGLAYAKNQEVVLARRALQKALALKADFSGAQEARAVLESLKSSGQTER